MEQAVQQAILSSHVNTNMVTREELAAIPVPSGTDTFKPVAHIELVESIQAVLESRSITIEREQFAVRADGGRLFATFDLSLEGIIGSCGALGVRTGNDRTMRLQMLTGLRVFVCDNMVFSGDEIILNRKHTGRLDLLPELMGAITRFEARYARLRIEVIELTQLTLTENEAKALIHDAFVAEIMPIRFLPNVSKAYFQPQIAEFQPGNAWSLHNAFTGVMKEMTLNRRMQATQGLGRIFGLLGEGSAASPAVA